MKTVLLLAIYSGLITYFIFSNEIDTFITPDTSQPLHNGQNKCKTADVNCDTHITMVDLDLIKREFNTNKKLNKTDINADGVTDVHDFELWRERFFTKTSPIQPNDENN